MAGVEQKKNSWRLGHKNIIEYVQGLLDVSSGGNEVIIEPIGYMRDTYHFARFPVLLYRKCAGRVTQLTKNPSKLHFPQSKCMIEPLVIGPELFESVILVNVNFYLKWDV